MSEDADSAWCIPICSIRDDQCRWDALGKIWPCLSREPALSEEELDGYE